MKAWCEQRQIQLTRGRPYKKDDNAHVEQKNWTHVRKLLGWDRYDSLSAVEAMNDLHRHELRLWLNLYLPSVKLVRKVRVGSKLRRVYDAAQTPFERVRASGQGDPVQVAALQNLRRSLDPFRLAQAIDQKLRGIYELANRRQSPKASPERPARRRIGGRGKGCGKDGPPSRALEIPKGFPLSHSYGDGDRSVTFPMSRRSALRLHS